MDRQSDDNVMPLAIYTAVQYDRLKTWGARHCVASGYWRRSYATVWCNHW